MAKINLIFTPCVRFKHSHYPSELVNIQIYFAIRPNLSKLNAQTRTCHKSNVGRPKQRGLSRTPMTAFIPALHWSTHQPLVELLHYAFVIGWLSRHWRSVVHARTRAGAPVTVECFDSCCCGVPPFWIQRTVNAARKERMKVWKGFLPLCFDGDFL